MKTIKSERKAFTYLLISLFFALLSFLSGLQIRHFENLEKLQQIEENGYYNRLITLNLDAYYKASYWTIPFMISIILTILFLGLGIYKNFYAKEIKKEIQK